MKRKIAKNSNISLKRSATTFFYRVVTIVEWSLVSLLLVFLFSGFFQEQKNKLWNYFYAISKNQDFILKDLIVEGQNNTSLSNIVSLLKMKQKRSIFEIDLKLLKDNLEESNWIERVKIKRILPSTIHLYITEKTPIAIWQFKKQLYLIDIEGNRIAKYKNNDSKFANLPHVVGQDANYYAQYLIGDLDKYPNLKKRVKSSVRYGQRRWNINLDENITVKMPEYGFMQAYDYLNALHNKNKLFGQDYKIIDLRNKEKYFFEKNNVSNIKSK